MEPQKPLPAGINKAHCVVCFGPSNRHHQMELHNICAAMQDGTIILWGTK